MSSRQSLGLHSGWATHIGRNRERKTNQDWVAVHEPVSPACADHLYIVCDGMGGHRAGDVASRVVANGLVAAYGELGADYPVPEILARALTSAHAALRRSAEQDGLDNRGTTAVVAAVRGPQLHIANVGDSRAYLISDGQIRQLTRDHSRLAELVQAGVLTAQQAARSNDRNVLTRSLTAARPTVEFDLFEQTFSGGDILVLCSDGLWGCVAPQQIQTIAERLRPDRAASKLIKLANNAGGPDNISVIIVRRGPVQPSAEFDTGELEGGISASSRRPRRRIRPHPVLVTVLLAAGLAAAALAVAATWLFLIARP